MCVRKYVLITSQIPHLFFFFSIFSHVAFLLSLIASVSVSTEHLIYHRNEKLKTLDHFIVHIFGKFLKNIQDFKLVVLLVVGNRGCFFK